MRLASMQAVVVDIKHDMKEIVRATEHIKQRKKIELYYITWHWILFLDIFHYIIVGIYRITYK